jgi:hypothetical protein
MKKILPVLFLLIFLTKVQKVHSQDLFQEYLSSTSKYKSDYEAFVLAKSRFMTYKSLDSEQEAIEKTKTMLLSKVELVKNYLNLIRSKFATETGIQDYKENLTCLQLDNQIEDVSSLKDKIIACQTLSELNEVDLLFEKKYLAAQKLSFKTLGLINLRKFTKFNDIFSEQINLLEEKIAEVKTESNFDTSLLERRTSELKNQAEQQKNNLTVSSKSFLEKADSNNPKEAYLEFISFLEKLKENFANMILSFQEVINSIKKL